MKTGITFISPTQGNPIALKRTIDSLVNICDEFIVGDVCIFEQDRAQIKVLCNEYNLKLVPLGFDFIFKNGFSHTLNTISSFSTNDICVYLNVGEIVEKGGDEVLSKISPQYNIYYIDHGQENHRWWRMYNRNEVVWSGLIHEETVPIEEEGLRPYCKPIFRFADTDKDTISPFKAKVMNDVKETVYWRNLMRMVDEPESIADTNQGWVDFATREYESMYNRLMQKGKRYEAFLNGNFEAYMEEIMTSTEFEKERFETTKDIEFQGDKKFLL